MQSTTYLYKKAKHNGQVHISYANHVIDVIDAAMYTSNTGKDIEWCTNLDLFVYRIDHGEYKVDTWNAIDTVIRGNHLIDAYEIDGWDDSIAQEMVASRC